MSTTPDPTMPVIAYLYPRRYGSGVGFVRPANYVDEDGAVVQADDLIRQRDAEARIAELQARLEEAEKARSKSPHDMTVAELQAAMAPLQMALHHKVCGDPRKGLGDFLATSKGPAA